MERIQAELRAVQGERKKKVEEGMDLVSLLSRQFERSQLHIYFQKMIHDLCLETEQRLGS